VGGAAQTKATKKVAGTLKLSLAQYREMAAFSQFGSDLDAATQEQLANGERQTEILKQGQYQPLAMEDQVVSIYAATPQEGGAKSWVRDLELDDVGRYSDELLAWMRANRGDLLGNIRGTGKLSDEDEAKLKTSLDEFAKNFQPSRSAE
jgi:F-type H+-transporting ATPase subunit alpha